MNEHNNSGSDCFVCRKHREQGSLLPGGPVGADDLVLVSHLSPGAPGRSGHPVYLGHLLVEPRRHAPGLPDLTGAEAERVGWWCTAASQALRNSPGGVTGSAAGATGGKSIAPK